MEIKQKLQIIQQLSGLTQTELAKCLGISFPTLNSWINARSHPHTAKLKKIDALYSDCTGQKTIPQNPLIAKKEIIFIKAKKYSNIISHIKNRPDLYDEFTLALTYNTNSMEGSTLTENETADIIFHGKTFKNKDLVEHLEAKNHQAALNYLFGEITQRYEITENFIKKLHEILMNNIRTDAGLYRSHGVRIVGANVPTANYLSVPKLMKSVVKKINHKQEDVILHVAQIHGMFEQIHPFSDGNGRVGRLIMTAMLLKQNLPPAVIKKGRKRAYYSCLQGAQQKGEFDGLDEFICDALLTGLDVLGLSARGPFLV